ncbi:glycoside hydrolase family 3 protein [uncultured Ruminococcus sp.]|uniref:glycoside hydrolase family 3 protein n=1 Tax=uncultured Ruminococcus sp. TaxID=165186 RepID=UPI0025E97A7F|nr:glycoside hydrolase family 3 N-terminal domain-containing protein [uncultured Ruminococcus sp.]
MSKSKNNKAAAKVRRIAVLAALLVVTGAGSAAVIAGYLKNRPSALEESSSAVAVTVSEKSSSEVIPAESETAEEKPEIKDDSAPAEEKTESKADEKKPAEKTDSSADESKAEKPKENSLPKDESIEAIMDDMTLHEKVCQMCIVTPEGLTGYGLVTEAGDATVSSLSEYPVGGLIYFAQNLVSVDQTKNMISSVQSGNSTVSDIPLFIAVDEEGGGVARCADQLGTTSFRPMYEYRFDGTDTAYSNAYTIAQDISALGFNVDFAPVADTWTNPANTVIGTRAYSDDYSEAAKLVASAVKGFNDGGVICSVKHFPGHGDTSADSHYGAAASYQTADELMAGEYLPFKSGIAAGAEMVMVGHINMVNIDDTPASVSYTMITGELRGKLGYDGVVITDSLAMGAMANYYSSDEIAVKVIQAGGDILLMPYDLASAVNGVENAVANGDISEERIDESVYRILKLKKDRNIL